MNQALKPSQKNVIGFRNDSYVEARLGRWGIYQRWLRRSRIAGQVIGLAPARSWWWTLIMQPNVQGRGQVIAEREQACPVDRQEAGETTRCIAVLPGDLRRWVVEVYVKGGTVRQQMRALCIMGMWTYYTLQHHAYDELLGYFNDLAAGVSLPPIDSDEEFDVDDIA